MGSQKRAVRSRIRSSDCLAFTLVELLMVILIIAILISIIIPVIGKVRRQAYAATTRNFVNQLSSAIERYQSDFKAYPGPISNDAIYNSNFTVGNFPTIPNAAPRPLATAVPGYDSAIDSTKITGSENLVLGLLGGLTVDPTTGSLYYNPTFVKDGPSSLNLANPKKYTGYMEAIQLSNHSTTAGISGRFTDEACPQIQDSNIPEFVDNFPESMPVLYLRSKVGVPFIPKTTTGYDYTKNSVITNGSPGRPGSYDLSQIIAYTASYNAGGAMETAYTNGAVGPPPADYSNCIGTAKRAPTYIADGARPAGLTFNYHGLRTLNPTATGTPGTAKYDYPYDAFPYFEDPANVGSARKKDSYILIAAGIDRMYGTSDDIVSFGTVGE